jgi:hypothetical protein
LEVGTPEHATILAAGKAPIRFGSLHAVFSNIFRGWNTTNPDWSSITISGIYKVLVFACVECRIIGFDPPDDYVAEGALLIVVVDVRLRSQDSEETQLN